MKGSENKMTRQATKAIGNMYFRARKLAGISSREEASRSLYVEPETIGKWETDKCVPGPESVLLMSDLYGDPLLINHYCTDKCPIGANYYNKLDNKDLAVVSLQMIRSLRELEDAKDKLLDITEDGVIEDSEIVELDFVMNFFDKMEKTIQELRLSIKKELNSDQTISTQG